VICIRYRSIIGTCIDCDKDSDRDRIDSVQGIVVIIVMNMSRTIDMITENKKQQRYRYQNSD
jgi:hypothetical protein